MATGLITDERFLLHHTGAGHPERADRLRAVTTRFHGTGLLNYLQPLPFTAAPLELLRRIHAEEYLQRLENACARQEQFIDVPDSTIVPISYEIAKLAVGGVLAAVDAVRAGQVANAFCAIRPPGHHAERDRSMGFCLLNNIAAAAEHLVCNHQLKRVAIVDFDVHHGNGTQHIFEDRADVLFISIHQDPRTLYPGTGFASETGVAAGKGFTLNIEAPPGGDDAFYREAFQRQILPRLRDYHPEFLLISAGFDAARNDPLALMELSDGAFAWMTQQLMTVADECCNGQLVSLLEGGYDLQTLARCVELHVRSLVGQVV